MLDIQVIDDPAAATVALGPMRSRLLSELVTPASAATLATRVGLARQKINYHLHALEAHGLVQPGARNCKWGGLTERLLVATAKFPTSFRRAPPWARSPWIQVGKPIDCPRAISSPWAMLSGNRSAKWLTSFVVRPRRANVWRPWRWIPRFASGHRRTGRRSAPNSPKPSRNSFRNITMNPPPAAARIAW